MMQPAATVGRIARKGKTFSAKTAAVTTPIQNRLLAPRANKTTIRPTQHPTHQMPCPAPIRKAPGSPSRHSCSGEAQRPRHAFFSGLSW